MKESADNLNIHAIELASQGHFTEAIACFKRAIGIDKSNLLLWYNLGVTYRDSGDLESAKQVLLTAFEIDEYDEDLLETLALVCFSLDEIDEAFDYCARAIEINEHNSRVWNTIGVLYFSKSEFSEASVAFERAVTLCPYYYDALYNLRDAYDELGNKAGKEDCENRLKDLKSQGPYA